MKLTIDVRLIRGSGIGVYIQNLLKNDHLKQFDLTLLVNKNDLDFTASLCPHARLKQFNAKLYSIKELLQSPFHTYGCDIFWTPHYNVPIINFAKRLKIVTVHDVYHLAYFKSLSLQQKVYSTLMLTRAVRESNIVFTVSNFSRNEIIERISCNADKIKVIYNGIEYDRFSRQYSKTEQETILNKYKLPGKYLLFVGNVKPHKNLRTALIGYKEYLISCNEKDLKFVIVGKKDGFIIGDEEVKEMIHDEFYKDKILFTGWVADEDLALLYQKAALFIFPSVYEGFGFPPLEAMAAGCPVISSNTACMPEIYKDAAIYFDPLNPNSIAGQIYQALQSNSTRKTLVERGREICRSYSWKESIDQKFSIISKFLN